MGKITKLSIFFGLLFLAFSFHSAHASENSTPGSSNKFYRSSDFKTGSNSAGIKSRELALTTTGATHGAMKKVKLSEARMKICEMHASNISMRFKNLLGLGEKSHENFNDIVTRVDAFYTSKLVPAGYALPNYDALKSDITTKQTAVQTALTKAQTDGASFSCDSDDPKGSADTFRQDIQALIIANKAYKLSVRTFVVSVRDLALKAKAAKLSPSPVVSPVASPEATEAPSQ